MTYKEITPTMIKQLREHLGRTQEGMAGIVGTTGVSWSRWESGTHSPLPVYAEKLVKLLKFAGIKEGEDVTDSP